MDKNNIVELYSQIANADQRIQRHAEKFERIGTAKMTVLIYQ